MSQPYADALSWVPKSRDLATTLARAFDYAKSQLHRTVTLEHLLLALIADKDASTVLQACHVDLDRLSGDASSYVAESVERSSPGESSDPIASPELIRIVEYAAAAARQSRRREVNGAIVLAAIVGDGRSAAASMLRDQGLTFEEAIKALQKVNATARSAGQPPTQSAPEPGHQAAPEAQSGGPEAGRPVSQEPYLGHNQRNGPSGLTTEDILAAARRRVATGINGTRRPEASPPVEDSVHAQDHGRAHGQPDGRYSPEQPEPTSARPRAEVQHGPRPKPGPASLPPEVLRSEIGKHGHDAPAKGPSIPHGAQHHHQGESGDFVSPEPAPRGSNHVGPPAPTLDWPSHSRTDGYYRPQVLREPDAKRPPPPPRMPGQPVQGAGQAHPPPPPHYRREQSPWSEPTPPPFAPGEPPLSGSRSSQHGARPKATPGHEVSTATEAFAGQLVENIPRRMTAHVPELIEISIAKAEVKALAGRLQGSGTAYRHDVVVTKAMSVRLRAPEGGFWIEMASPETQWIENTLGLLSDDYASWRWIVTPQRRGRARLQLIVSARTVGADGLAAETALPDQVVEVKIRTNYHKTAVQWGGWIAAAGLGAILARFGEGVWEIGSALLTQIGLI